MPCSKPLAARTGFFALNAAPAQALPAELLERCELVIVNKSEYELIPELRSAKRVAVTYGAGGASMYTRGVKTAHAPASKTSVVNSVGAGDAFCAALVLALSSGLDEESSLAAACAVGAAAVASELSQPEFERLEHYLRN